LNRDRSHLLTERINPRTADIDTLDVSAILDLIHAEDHRALEAVGEVLDPVGRAVDLVVAAFRRGGRLVYIGAGTSGRLGTLDAAECPPTFGSDPERVQAIVAGGEAALVRSIEGAEDSESDGAEAIAARAVGAADVVVGIAAGSTTPFVIGGLCESIDRGAKTIFLTSIPSDKIPIANQVDVVITPLTGAEVIAGSTRMKAGTATKLVLNMITTAAMVRLGKTYGNLMVDLRVTSAKLEDRGRRILRELLGVSYEDAGGLLASADGRVKTALVMHRRGVDRSTAEQMLEEADGFLRRVWD
jgi:N-acetylmuramic acid 6-phosphate etherase